MPGISSFKLTEKFVVLNPEKVARTLMNSPTVYQELDRQYGDFKGHELIATHTFEEDWPSWEVHPNGDEIVVLLSGAATFIVELDGMSREVEMAEPGDTVIVPRGCWHTAKIPRSASMLFITPGEGTVNDYDR